MLCSLALPSWPAADRLAWAESCRPALRLRPGGRASHLSLVTQEDLQRRYGYFLQVLQETGRLDTHAPAGTQATPENVEAFLARGTVTWNSVTLSRSVYKLRRMANPLSLANAPRDDGLCHRESPGCDVAVRVYPQLRTSIAVQERVVRGLRSTAGLIWVS
jgi:hypothetical protein